MSELRRALVWVAMALASAGAASAADEPYVMKMPVTPTGPFPYEEYKALDESAIVRLCRDDDGCTLSLKMDGPGNLLTATERIYLSSFSLRYTTTLPNHDIQDGPYVDGDHHNQVLAYTQTKSAAGIVSCDVTDQDDNQTHLDLMEGFTIHIIATAPNLGTTTCVLTIFD